MGYKTIWISENPWMLLLDAITHRTLQEMFDEFVGMEYMKDGGQMIRGGYPEVSRKMMDDAIDLVDLHGSSPVFMMLLTMNTHHAYYDGENRHPIKREWPEWNYANKMKSIKYFDGLAGELFEAFRGTGRSTDVVVTANHGEMFGPGCISHNPIAHDLIFDEKLFEIPFIRGMIE